MGDIIERAFEPAGPPGEQLLNTIIDNMDEVVWFLDPGDRLAYLSNNQEEITGYSADILLGKSIDEVFRLVHDRRSINKIRVNVEQRMRFTNTISVVSNSGKRRMVWESRGMPLYDSKGRYLGYLGFTRNITQRKRVDGELVKSNARFKDIIETLNVTIWELNYEGVVTYISPQVEIQFGLAQEELIGLSIKDIKERFSGSGAKKILEMFESMEPFHDLEITLEGAEERAIGISGTPVYDDEGGFLGYRGVMRDITYKKKADERDRWNRGFLRFLEERSDHPFYTVDADTGRVLNSNQQFVEMWGLEKLADRLREGDVSSTELTKYFLSKVEDRAAFIVDPPLPSEAHAQRKDRLVLADGRTIERTSSSINAAGGKRLGKHVVFRDITGQLQDEQRTRDRVQLLTCMLDKMEMGIIGVGPTGLVQYMNKGAERLTGFVLDEIDGRPMSSILLLCEEGADHAPFEIAYRRSLVRRDLRLRTKRGAWKSISCSVRPCRSAHNDIGTIVMVWER